MTESRYGSSSSSSVVTTTAMMSSIVSEPRARATVGRISARVDRGKIISSSSSRDWSIASCDAGKSSTCLTRSNVSRSTPHTVSTNIRAYGTELTPGLFSTSVSTDSSSSTPASLRCFTTYSLRSKNCIGRSCKICSHAAGAHAPSAASCAFRSFSGACVRTPSGESIALRSAASAWASFSSGALAPTTICAPAGSSASLGSHASPRGFSSAVAASTKIATRR